MNNMRIRKGETLPISGNDKELGSDAQTITLTASKNDEVPVISYTTEFFDQDGKRVFEMAIDTSAIAIGEYDYMYTVTYGDGSIAKFPDSNDCEDDDCSFPTITICEALDLGVS